MQLDGLKMRPFRRRIRWMRAWRLASIGAVAGMVVALIEAALDYASIRYAETWMLVAPVVAGILIGLVRAFTERLDDRDVARSIDRRAGLQDRLTTAAELRADAGPMFGAQHDDAIRAASTITPSAVYRFRLNRWHGTLAALAVVTTALFLFGNSPLFQSPSHKAEAAEMRQTAKEVERVAKPVLEEARKPEATAQDKALARNLDKFTRDLRKARMTRQESLVKANDLADQARKLETGKADAAAQSIKDAQTAGDAATKMGQQSSFEPSEAQALAKKAAAAEQAIAAMERQLASAKSAQSGKSSMNEAQRKALEKRLEAARKNLANIRLSQRAELMLRRLAANKDFLEAQKLLQKLAATAAQQKAGARSGMTKQQLEEAVKRIEELAKRLNSEAALREYAKKLLEAAKRARLCNGNCANPLLAACGLGAGMGSGQTGAGGMSLGGKGRGAASPDKWVGAHGSLSMDDKSSLLKVKFEDRVVKSQIGDQGPETYTETMAPSAPGDKSGIPYQKVLPAYRKSAESALNKQDIPPRMRGKVRNYFDSLRK